MRRRCGDILCPALAPDFGDAKKGAPWKAPTAKGNAHCLRSLSKSFRGIQRPRSHGMRPTPFPGCATAMAVSGAERQGSPPMRPTPSRPRDCNGGERYRRAGWPTHAPYSFPAARQLRRRAVPKSGANRPCTYTFSTARQPRRWALPKGKAAHPCALSLPCRAAAKTEGGAEE